MINTFKVDYMGGHPEISKPMTLELVIAEDHITLQRISYYGDIVINISKEDIIDISIDEKGKRSAGKAAAGAIIGGALTGGIGLLAGAALGGRKKNVSKIFLTINYKVREFIVILQTGKKTETIYSQLVSLFA